MSIRKAHALRRKTIKIRRWNFGIRIVASHIAVAHVVCEDIDDIRLVLCHGFFSHQFYTWYVLNQIDLPKKSLKNHEIYAYLAIELLMVGQITA